MIDGLMKPINKIYNKWILKKNSTIYDKSIRINGRLYLMGEVEIGKNVSINSGFKFNPIGGQERTIFYARKTGKIIIGDNVGISNTAIFSISEIRIENNVKIGGACKIYDNDFHSLEYTKRMMNEESDVKTLPVVIKEGAFIGAHSIVLKGVTIGSYSIVGAGSVVASDIPDGEIWAGNPAKFIRKLEF